MKAERSFLPTPGAPQSLCWSGDSLIDWVAGGLQYHLDGKTSDPCVRYAYRFDAAVMSPDGRYTVLYEKLGTKGLLLREGKILRELNRSFYHAEAYEYPVALHTFPSGRTILAHCPDDYCRIELEDADTGQRLTQRKGESPDAFHSRLQFSRDGRYLLSAGWVWHPLDLVWIFDVERALEAPESLDQLDQLNTGDWGCELFGAAFGENGTLFIHSDVPAHDGAQDPESLGIYSLTERRMLATVPLEQSLGTFMAVGPYLLNLLGHPSLIEPSSGRVLERWPEFDTGRQGSSIIHHIPRPPPIAWDPAGRRIAVGTEKGIELLRFTE